MGLIFQYLDTVGDGSGSNNATGDYSSVAQDFAFAPAAGKLAFITRMIVSVEDEGGMQAQEYGNLDTALTNGISILLIGETGETLLDLTAGEPIKTNAQWAVTCYDADVKGWGSGDDLLAVRWTFEKSGRPVTVDGHNSERLVARLNDDFSGLLLHRFMIQGYT